MPAAKPPACDYRVGLVASGEDKGIKTSCAYCGRSMPLDAIAAHVAAKHPRRKECV